MDLTTYDQILKRLPALDTMLDRLLKACYSLPFRVSPREIFDFDTINEDYPSLSDKQKRMIHTYQAGVIHLAYHMWVDEMTARTLNHFNLYNKDDFETHYDEARAAARHIAHNMIPPFMGYTC